MTKEQFENSLRETSKTEYGEKLITLCLNAFDRGHEEGFRVGMESAALIQKQITEMLKENKNEL